MRSILVSLAAWMILAQGVVLADVTSVQTVTIPNNTQSNWNTDTPSLSGINPLIFNKFDTSLGTLQSVNLTVAYTITQSVKLTFTPVSSATQNATLGSTTSLPSDPTQGTNINLNLGTGSSATNLVNIQAPVLQYSKTYNAGSTTQVFSTDLPPTSPYYLTPVNGSSNVVAGSVSKTLTDPSQLGLFTGSGTIGLPADATSGSTHTISGGNGGVMNLTYAGITVSISYNYTPNPVPEPSSVALLGIGGGGLLVMVRRSRRRSAA